MKKLLIPVAVFFLAFSSCSEDPTPLFICGVTDPVLELTWLNELTTEINAEPTSEYFYISAGKYQGNDVFIMKNCCPVCDILETVHSCDGQEIGFLTGDGSSISPTEISDEQVLWRGFNFSCGV